MMKQTNVLKTTEKVLKEREKDYNRKGEDG